jgi:copper chaperone
MKTEQIKILNLQCGGCANTITKTLSKIQGVVKVQVDVENKIVSVEYDDNIDRQTISEKLLQLGYPEENEKNSILSKIKSKKSCFIGKF